MIAVMICTASAALLCTMGVADMLVPATTSIYTVTSASSSDLVLITMDPSLQKTTD